MFLVNCPTAFPPWFCEHWNVVLYLLPSIVLALVFHLLARRHPVFFGFYLSSTILHELAHLFAGFATNAKPVSFTVIPRRTNASQWTLGSVSFANIRWYNAAFVGLAPVLVLSVPVLVAVVRMHFGMAYDWLDVLIAVLVAPAFLSFLPSRVDLQVAMRSWPYLVIVGGWLWWRWR